MAPALSMFERAGVAEGERGEEKIIAFGNIRSL
jgi:hypothetical protein